jgi:hypothetical protein
MSCAVCYGYPGCPCCSPEPQTVTCPACKGTGEIYYNSDGERITKEEYDKLPADHRECDSCAECDGSGEIEYDDEPDWDSMPGGHDYY